MIYIYIYYILYIACPEHCVECQRINFTDPFDISSENFICKACEDNYFLNSEKFCVTSGECGIKYYPESSTLTCNLCSQACLGCTCPTNRCCLECQKKFFLTKGGNCELLECQPDEYLVEDMTCQSNLYEYIYIYISL